MSNVNTGIQYLRVNISTRKGIINKDFRLDCSLLTQLLNWGRICGK